MKRSTRNIWIIVIIAMFLLGTLFFVLKNPEPNPAPVPTVTMETTEQSNTYEDPYMILNVPELDGVTDLRVKSGAIDNEEYLRESALHVDSTGYPNENNENVYIAGHRLGYPGTDSHRVFYDLDELSEGDEIYLEDSKGRNYAYEVFEKKVVEADDLSVLESRGNDTITLQTCTLPDYEDRIVVVGKEVIL